MYKYLIIVQLLISFAFSDCRQMYLSFHSVEGAEVTFEMEDFLYGEDNCCDEYPISFCEEGTIYYEKEDYADINEIENWDIISTNIALLRGDNQMLYNPLAEVSYGSGSPQNTLWKGGATYGGYNSGAYGDAGVLNIIYVPKYLPGTIGSFYSIPDNQYYDIHFISWTSGGGTGWPGGGADGDGGGGGGGVGYWRSGPVNAAPKISQIIDVPNDQGGRVYITIDRSTLDLEEHPFGLDIYTVKRLDSGNWVEIGSFGAQHNTQYIFEATTLQDSSNQNFELSTYKIVAQNFVYDFIFESEPGFGFSIDNIAPEVPNGLMMTLNENYLELTWNEVSDADFQYYVIERDNTLEFINPQSYETVEPYFLVSDYNSEQDYFYRLYAVDYAGNSSDYSNILDATALSNQNLTVPNSFFLHQNYPNPFNPTTRINYDLPNDGNVLIKISDVKGNHIRTLVDDYVQMGLKFIVWDARNNNGEKVPAGIYFYTFKVNDFLQTQKMILLK